MWARGEIINKMLIFIILFLFGFTSEVYSGFEFTNLKCVAVDPKFAEFDYCFLKSVNRTYKYASLKIKVHQLPVNDVTVGFALSKRLNGYKPFLYNFTFDYCNYMRNPNPGNKVVNFFYSVVKPYSNINHTCPYTGDIIVDKIPINFLNHKVTKVLPVPEGDYRVTGNILAYGIKRVDIFVYFKIF